MKRIVVMLVLFLCSAAVFAQQANPPLDIPTNIRNYFVVLLVKTPKLDEISKEQLQELFRKHLSYIRSQIEAGKYKLAGPFRDDGKYAGLLIVDAPAEDAAKEIVSHDPFVEAGALTVESHPASFADMSGIQVRYAHKGNTK